MKLVIIADALDTQSAGIFVYCKYLLEALDRSDPDHEIFVIRSKATNDFKNLKEIVVPVKGFPLHFRYRQLFSIPKIINDLNPDIVFETAHFGPFRINENIKRATFIHDLTPIQFPQWHPTSSVLAHRLLIKRKLRMADLVLTNSNHSETIVHQYYPFTKNKTAVTYLAAKHKYDIAVDKKPTLDKFNITKAYYLFAGTLEPRKNLKCLYNAYNKMKDDNKPQLVLVGKKGWIDDSFYEELASDKNIKLTGYISEEDLQILYQNALAFVYPSWYEGFGLPVLEAMQHSCPVICSYTSVLPEIVKDAALMFDPSKEDQLKDRLLAILNNKGLSNVLKQKGLKRVEAFSWEKTAKETISFLENMLV